MNEEGRYRDRVRWWGGRGGEGGGGLKIDRIKRRCGERERERGGGGVEEGRENRERERE